MQSCNIFFDVSIKKLLNKQSSGWWFERPWCSCDVTIIKLFVLDQHSTLPISCCKYKTDFSHKHKCIILQVLIIGILHDRNSVNNCIVIFDINRVMYKNSPPTLIVTYCKSINTQFTWSDLAAATTSLDLEIAWESAMWLGQTRMTSIIPWSVGLV